jgi:hypothetical protein
LIYVKAQAIARFHYVPGYQEELVMDVGLLIASVIALAASTFIVWVMVHYARVDEARSTKSHARLSRARKRSARHSHH